ncbi:MAG: hypothetical protein FJ267_07325 [Planctomycetes bacterium]|nr:hypothetical protein [Planctomycetota bacterium]
MEGYTPSSEDYAAAAKAAIEYLNAYSNGCQVNVEELLQKYGASDQQRETFMREILEETIEPLAKLPPRFRDREISKRADDQEHEIWKDS